MSDWVQISHEELCGCEKGDIIKAITQSGRKATFVIERKHDDRGCFDIAYIECNDKTKEIEFRHIFFMIADYPKVTCYKLKDSTKDGNQ